MLHKNLDFFEFFFAPGKKVVAPPALKEMSTVTTGQKRRRCDETPGTLVETKQIHEIINAQTNALKKILLQEILKQNERCVCVCVCVCAF